MSKYTYTAADMVQLPRLSGADAMALGEQLVSAARPHRKSLQRPVTRALTALAARHGDLKETLRDQVVPDLDPGASAVPQDRALDGCWGGLDGFLAALGKLPATYPQAAEAAELRAAILPDGLGFLNYPHIREWTESELRLQRMGKAGLDQRVEALGGGLFLGALRDAHAAYGKVLGMTSPLELPAPASPGVRDALDAFTAALRDYVVKVMAAIEPGDRAGQALAERLLAPLSAWTSMTPARGNAKPAPKAEDPAPGTEALPPGAPAPASEAHTSAPA
jgi:hypothetical protein